MSSDESEDFVGLKEGLANVLGSITAPGSFAGFEGIASEPPADLWVHGLGPLSMPLNEQSANGLIGLCHQAPFGRGSETIVDTAVRNTWELDATQFEFRSQAWPTYMSYVVSRAAAMLGITVPIKAELYKMLVYGKGAMFKPHTDTEKIPGMFGTLVISLPSRHTGGDVVVRHCGEKHVYRTSQTPHAIITWYSDVTHEVLPITSGYRWVLTYNLALDQAGHGPRPSAGLMLSPYVRDLRKTIKAWSSEEPSLRDERYVYHVLDHDYTEAQCSMKSLKADDRARVMALTEACKDLPVEIFLALLEKEESGNCESHYEDRYRSRGYYGDEESENESDEEDGDHHALEDVMETNYSVETLVDLHGRTVAQNLDLDNDCLTREDIWDEIDIHKEDYEGYMGNWGPQATHWYRVTAVAIVPRDTLVEYLSPKAYKLNSTSINLSIGYFARTCLERKHQSSATILEALKTSCKAAWTAPPNKDWRSRDPVQLDGDVLHTVLRAALELGQYEFFEEAAGKTGGVLSADFFLWVKGWIGRGDPVERFGRIKHQLIAMLTAYPHFADRYAALSKALPADEAAPDVLLEWVHHMIITSVSDAFSTRSAGVDARDGKAMVDAILLVMDPASFMTSTLMTYVGPRQDRLGFSLAFLSLLHELWTHDTVPEMESKCLYFKIVDQVIEQPGMFKDMSKAVRKDACSTKTVVEISIAPKDIALFLQNLISVESSAGSSSRAAKLVAKIEGEASASSSLDLFHIWFPFLVALLPILKAEKISLTDASYQQLFATFFTQYVDKFVGKKPSRDRSLARPRVGCGCSDCSALNRFLVDPNQQIQGFAVNKQRRAHLHRQLDGSGIDCTHETERRGSPQTLVVTKTFKHFAEKKKLWEGRYKRAQEEFAKFEELDLRILVGDRYDDVVRMQKLATDAAMERHAQRLASANARAIASSTSHTLASGSGARAHAGPLGAARSGAINGSIPAQLAGTKRKAFPPSDVVVIDLTSD